MTQTDVSALAVGFSFEALKRQPAAENHPDLDSSDSARGNEPPPGDSTPRKALEEQYDEAIQVAEKSGLPLLLFTPTRRISRRELNSEAVDLVRAVMDRRPTSLRVAMFSGGLIESAAGANHEALDAEAALRFHSAQAEQLSGAGVDFLFGISLTAFSEALGMAQAMSLARKPYGLSFVISQDGNLSDGMALPEAIVRIEMATSPSPSFYLVNCVHPQVFESAMEKLRKAAPETSKRIWGLLANTSAQENPKEFAEQLARARQNHSLRILGGCCGTDLTHFQTMAGIMRSR